MLWVALHLPRLALEALWRDPVSPEPIVIVENGMLQLCDKKAHAFGLHPGMRLAAAYALAPRLNARPRDEGRERAALEGLAAGVCRFTPSVSIEPPHDLLAEVAGSLRLYGGLAALVGRMRDVLDQLGFTSLLAAAPTARAALWLAAAGRGVLIEDPAALRSALITLPATLVCTDPRDRALLRDIGVATLGELLALPRAGLARRFGKRLLDDLDRALGNLPEPRRFFVPAARFAANIEFDAEVLHAGGIVFAARRLLAQLEGVLAAHQAGVRRFTLTLAHRRAQSTVIEIGLGSPGREVERFLRLLNERIGTIQTIPPIEALRIEAGDFEPYAASIAGLFPDAQAETENWARFVERLQARLGGDAVHRLALYEDHRPEFASRVLGMNERKADTTAGAAPRPFWLLESPRRLRESQGVPQRDGPLELLAGPERIESGWWDEAEVRRDYFVARAPDAALLWVFREPGGGWYLHGLFS